MDEPTPADADQAAALSAPRVRYHFEKIADGRWYRMRTGPADWVYAQHRAENERIRAAARDWGVRNGWRAQSRTREKGRQFWIRFTAIEA